MRFTVVVACLLLTSLPMGAFADPGEYDEYGVQAGSSGVHICRGYYFDDCAADVRFVGDAEGDTAVSVFGNATGDTAVSGTGEATSTCQYGSNGALPCAAVSGTDDAHGTATHCPGQEVEETPACRNNTPLAVSGTGNASGEIAVSGTGDASNCHTTGYEDCEPGSLKWSLLGTCDGAACGDIQLGGDAQGEVVAVSVFGNASCNSDGCIAVSGTGDAGRRDQTCTDAKSYPDFLWQSTLRCQVAGIAVSGTGNATGETAVSGTGTAQTCTGYDNCDQGIAVSGTGDDNGHLTSDPQTWQDLVCRWAGLCL